MNTAVFYQLSKTELLSKEKIFLEPEFYAAYLAESRKQRFIENYYSEVETINLIKKFFSNKSNLLNNGLVKYFNELKKHVCENLLIGLILYGLELNDILINNFIDKDNNKLNLTVSSISRILIWEYFTHQELLELCQKMPNYNMYYDTLINNSK